MNPKLKSLLTSAAIIFIYFFATLGIVRLFWNTRDIDKFEGRAKLLILLLFVFSLIFIIGIYHIVGVAKVDNYYYGLIIFHFIYLVLGLIVYMILPENQ